MRLAIAINGQSRYTASLSGAGYLSAHLNLANRPKENEAGSVLRIEGFDTNSDSETVSVKWPEIPLQLGDVAQIRVLEDGPGDAPSIRRSTVEAPSNLFADESLAKDLLALCADFEKRLFELMQRSESVEPEAEHRKFKRAVGNVVVDLGEHLLSPVWRRHPKLIPQEMKGELL
jgi:hypothetical protein